MNLSLAIVPPSRFSPMYFAGKIQQVVVTVAVGEYRGEPIVVGWGIGEARDGEVFATDICQLVFERVIALTEPETHVHIYTLTDRKRVKANLRAYLEKNRPRALVVLCADSAMYDDISFFLKPIWRMQ